MLEKRYREYKDLAKRITKGDERYIDLLHDVLIQLESNEKWNNLPTDKEKMYFLSRVITNQFYSNNSYFNKTYRKFNSEVFDIPDIPDVPYYEKPTVEWINKLLEQELITDPDNWYNIGLFKLYMEHKSIESIYKRTNIPRYSIRETINQMKLWIRIKWDNRWEE